MDPPDAFKPPREEPIEPGACHPFLEGLMADHRALLGRLEHFEAALAVAERDGVDSEVGGRLLDFLASFEATFPAYRRRHEAGFFPLLRERMLRDGEHARTPDRHTGIDVLERDHDEALKQAAVARAFFAVGVRLPDPDSSSLALGIAVQQSRKLLDNLRLLVLRKDRFIYGLAQRLLSTEELDGFGAVASRA